MPFLFGLDRVPYQIGLWLGSAARSATDEAQYLKHRAGSATERERSSWIRRCVLSCLLVAGETVLLINIGTIVGSPATLVIGWATVLLLPRPTPRLPLFYARWLAMIFTVANMGSSYHWLKTRFPAAVEPWGEIVGILGFFVWIGLCVWAFLAFRRPTPQETEAPRAEPLKTQTTGVPFRVVAGNKHVKREVTSIRRSREPDRGGEDH
jgi:hypothetical protein